MFGHNFKYSLKIFLRSKQLIFWTFAFPIILGTFFNMAFSNIEKSEELKLIDIAIVSDNEFMESEIYKNAFKTFSDKDNPDRLFNTKYTSLSVAKSLLDDKKIIGYLKINNGIPKIVIRQNGFNETIFKSFVEEISQNSDMISNLIAVEFARGNYNVNYESIYKKVIDSGNINNVLNDKTKSNMSYTMISFYTLIAMTCLYGGLLSLFAVNQNLANMSSQGKRVSISPTKKMTTVLSSLCSSYVIQLIGLILLFTYTTLVLKVNYGDNFGLIVLLSLLGSLAGLSLGLFVGTTVKASDNAKRGIIISVTMLFCFLSGMMGVGIKYLVDTNIPFLNKINPASMITDGFYSLYYYSTLDRFNFNVISLSLFSLILIIISYFNLRRQKYDSI